jgi:hypothetical protein
VVDPTGVPGLIESVVSEVVPIVTPVPSLVASILSNPAGSSVIPGILNPILSVVLPVATSAVPNLVGNIIDLALPGQASATPAVSIPVVPASSINVGLSSVPAILPSTLATIVLPSVAVSVPVLPGLPGSNPTPVASASSAVSATPIVSASAAASSAAGTVGFLQQVARFDNDAGIPLIVASPIGIYQDIQWTGFALAQPTTLLPALNIVTPQSAPNTASFSGLTVGSLLQGTGLAAMTVNYLDSTIANFDLTSFFYGCTVAGTTTLIGAPRTCTITIRGYLDDAGTQLAGTQTFTYTAPPCPLLVALCPGGAMQKAVVDPVLFKGVKRVNFGVTNPTLTAALIDTVAYTVNGKPGVTWLG